MNTTKTLNKRLFGIIIVLLMLSLLLPLRVFAADNILWDSYEIPSTRQKPRLVDNADLLMSYEKEDLTKKLDEISAKHQCNIAVLTVYSHSGPIQDFADDYFDYNGFGADYNGSGILFMLSMEDREWAISTSGSAITAFTDYGQEYMVKKMMGDLSDGYYGDAFSTYIDVCDYLLDIYSQGTAFDVDYKAPRTTGDYVRMILISLAIGLAVAFIPLLFMASELTTVKMSTGANDYQSKNGINISLRQDIFERKVLNKTQIQQSSGSRSGGSSGGGSSIHTSSSGSSHGGSHGHF